MNNEEWLSIYEANNIALIPANAGEKVPTINWKNFENTPPTKHQIHEWFNNETPKNWAILCGKASNNLVVLDFDVEGMFQKFFPNTQKICEWTWTVKSPHGWHVYLRPDREIKSFKIPGYVEVRSTGNIVIAPPSHINEKGSGKKISYTFNSRPLKIQGISDLENAIKDRAAELGANIKTKIRNKWLTTRLGETYTGETPPCIQTLENEPAPNGERDDRAIRIAAYYANFCGNQQKAYDKLTQWHQKIVDPQTFTLNETLTKVQHVTTQGYIYGCDDPFLNRNCNKQCKFENGRIAKKILKSSNILKEIQNLLDVLIAGENDNKLLLFLLCLSGKVADWSKKQIILLQGEAGGGKTTLANSITRLFNTKKIGRFSRHALDYSDLKGYEILYLQELGDVDKEEEGLSTLKFLSADDKGYKIEITVRDPKTKQFTTQERIIPPITVVTSTTRTEIDPQLMRRVWPLYIDESVTQTRLVKQHKIKDKQEDNEIALGLKNEKEFLKIREQLTNIIKRLNNCKIVIPFPESLFDILNENRDTHLRLRGDYDKLWNLVWLLCFLMQQQLPKIKNNESSTLMASPTAVANMLEIIEMPLIRMTTDISSADIALIDALTACGMTEEGYVITNIGREEIAKQSLKNVKTVYKRLKNIADKTSLLTIKKEGKNNHFIIMSDVSSWKVEILNQGKIVKEKTKLALKFIEESKTWFSIHLPISPSRTPLKTGGFPVRRWEDILNKEESALLLRKETENNEIRSLFVKEKMSFPSRRWEDNLENKQVTDKTEEHQYTCNQCLNWKTIKCDINNPELIFATATYPKNCPKFKLDENKINE